jgi:allantoate deiminase
MHEVHRLVRDWMESAGMQVRVDAVGNLRGIYGDPVAPRLVIGSHLDTVPRAGAFDGVLGVMIGIALVDAAPVCAVEVVAFSEEEGVRFGVPFIGSRALVGDPVVEPEVLEAIRDFGLDPGLIPQAALGPEVRAYLEFHIEQGPVLDTRKQPLAVVESIVGQTRAEVEFSGQGNHAGTTPMEFRRDALTTAAEWIGFVEQYARGTPGLVATVGRLEVESGAYNVVPRRVRAMLDVRHSENRIREEAVERLHTEAKAIAARRGTSATSTVRNSACATAMNPSMVDALARALEATGYPFHRMPSGAGHDAMIVARKLPAGMLFLRSPNGISHDPDESVLEEDVAAALAAGARFLEDWGKRHA